MSDLTNTIRKRLAERPPGQKVRFIAALLAYSVLQIGRVVEEFVFDVRWFGRTTQHNSANPWRAQGYRGYNPSRAWRLRLLFSGVDLSEYDVAIDLGCGVGRVMRWLFTRGFRGDAYGIEINPELAAMARDAFARDHNVKIIQGDMCESLPRLSGRKVLLYASNPLRKGPMQLLKDRIEVSYGADCRVTVYYLDAACVDLFLADRRWDVRVIEDRHPSPLKANDNPFAAIMRLHPQRPLNG
jgi:SAM-dependent methyltransferase